MTMKSETSTTKDASEISLVPRCLCSAKTEQSRRESASSLTYRENSPRARVGELLPLLLLTPRSKKKTRAMPTVMPRLA